MTHENKKILLKDICSRLPYGVKVELTKYKEVCLLCGIDVEDLYLNIDSDPFSLRDFNIKPYLRPMSSMTAEEREEWTNIQMAPIVELEQYLADGKKAEEMAVILYAKSAALSLNYLNAHYFDYHGLIPMGLALEAPVDMYKTE